MTQQEWENATEAERTAEFERCKDPVYLYNTYWIKSDGTHPPPINHEQWEQIKAYAEQRRLRFKRRTPRRYYPPTFE